MSPTTPEIQILRDLSRHNHVLSFFDLRTEGVDPQEQYFAVLEQPESVHGTLREWLDTRGPMPASVAAGATKQIAKGLQWLHGHQLCHRDLRLQNMLVVSTPESSTTIKLLPVGLVQQLPSSALDQNSQHPSVVGSVGHVAPEVIQTGDHTYASNIWALGSC